MGIEDTPNAILTWQTDALSIPVPHFDKAYAIQHIINACVLQVIDLYTAFYDIYIRYSIEYGTLYTLDIIGKILDMPILIDLSLEDKRALLKALALIRGSDATLPDMYRILETATDTDFIIHTYDTGTYRSIVVESLVDWDTMPISFYIIQYLARLSKEAGCPIAFIWYEGFDSDNVLRFSNSDFEEADEDHGFGNDAGTTGGLLAGYSR